MQEIEADRKELYLLGRIPHGWQIQGDAIEPHKTRVNLGLDTDMVRWFRKLGPGYQARINHILRLYYHGVVSGEIEVDESGTKAVEPLQLSEDEAQKFAAHKEKMRAKFKAKD